MIDNLDDDIRMTADPARQAHLYVLAAGDVPSVLLEMGFLSNRHDEALLRQQKHQEVVARAVRDAIGDYFDGLTHMHDSRT
jgi:N-acetylmuramoyl-L-alanine amidase